MLQVVYIVTKGGFMKRLFVIIIGCISILGNFSGCGNCDNSKWMNFPQGIYVVEPKTETLFDKEKFEQNLLINVIQFYEEQLGFEVFYMSDTPNVPIKIFYDERDTVVPEGASAYTYLECKANDEIDIVQIWTKGESWSENHHQYIIHELWHALGFFQHSQDEDCIFYVPTNIYQVPWDKPLCDEMLTDWNERYPEYAVEIN